MSKRSRTVRGSSSRSQESHADAVLSWGVFNDTASTSKYTQLLSHKVEGGSIIDWNFLRQQGLEQTFRQSFQTDEFTGTRWENLFRMQEPVYEELVREFFATFHFDTAEARTDVGRTTVHFRLGVSKGHARLLSWDGG